MAWLVSEQNRIYPLQQAFLTLNPACLLGWGGKAQLKRKLKYWLCLYLASFLLVGEKEGEDTHLPHHPRTFTNKPLSLIHI